MDKHIHEGGPDSMRNQPVRGNVPPLKKDIRIEFEFFVLQISGEKSGSKGPSILKWIDPSPLFD